jgi:diacylglycerol kinase
MGLRHSTTKSFVYALDGLKTAFKKEPNFRVHVTIALVVLLVALFLKFNPIEWLILAFTISFVIALELLNTLLEAIVNLVSPDIKPDAKVAKDVSAAMVLVAATTSVLVGIALFLPKILKVF